MIMILMLPVKLYPKIADIQPSFFHAADFRLKPFHQKTIQCLFQYCLICSQIQKGSNCHIPTDTGITLQIHCISHILYYPFTASLLICVAIYPAP